MNIDMRKITTSVKTLAKEALSHKWKLAIGILVSMVLFVISTYYLFEGINKRFIIYSALCLMSGVFLVLPKLKKWYLAFPVLMIYLITVPSKLFVMKSKYH